VAREDEDYEPLRVPRCPELSDGNERSGFLDRAQFDILLSHLPDDLQQKLSKKLPAFPHSDEALPAISS